MATTMTEEDVKALVSSELSLCFGANQSGRLAEERRRAMYYYYGQAKDDLAPPDIDGRSSFVDTTVRNQIEWMIPQLMKTFTSAESVVEFTATKEGDDEKAQQATDYINYLFFKKNDGYIQLQTAIRDALLQKAGILKIWWDDRVEESRESYKALSEIDLAQMADDDEIEPIEQSSYPDEEDAEDREKALTQLNAQLQEAMQMIQSEPQQMGQPSPQIQQAMQAAQDLQQQIEQINNTPPKMLYDVTYKRTKKAGKVCVEAVPPEEFLISRKSKKISDGFMKGHRVLRSLSDLTAMGYKNVESISSDASESAYNTEFTERNSFDDDTSYQIDGNESVDPSMRLVWITEMYLQMDYDGDGIAEWRKIVRAGDQILENVECDGAPFAALIPILLPHRFFGLSIADLGIEPQRLQTQLVRSILDNQFLQVNGRYFAVDGQVNLDDLLTSRPGGVVRIKSNGAVGRLDQAQGDTGGAMQVLEWMQDFTENSTGWTRRSQGTGASSLQQQTATGMNIITNRDDMRLDLIARNFAEGGIKDLFNLMLKLVCQYQDKEEIINIAGSYVPINPREWKNQFTLNVNVGLGTNNKEQQAQHLMGMLGIQEKGLQIGIATPENIYNSAKLYAEALGQKSADKFFTDPAKAPPQAPKPDPEIIKAQAAQQLQQDKLQAEVQKHQAEMVQREKELQLEALRDQHKLELQAQKDAQKAQLDMQERQHEAMLRQALHEATIASDERKALLSAETSITVAQIGAESKNSDTLKPQTDDTVNVALIGLQEALNNLATAHAAPKQIIRDANGKAIGVSTTKE